MKCSRCFHDKRTTHALDYLHLHGFQCDRCGYFVDKYGEEVETEDERTPDEILCDEHEHRIGWYSKDDIIEMMYGRLIDDIYPRLRAARQLEKQA